MSNIIIIDDDAALNILAENLHIRGHEVIIYNSAKSALGEIEKLVTADLIILDLYMENIEDDSLYTVGTIRTSGMLVYREIRKKNKEIPIITYTALSEPDIIDIIKEDPHSRFLSKWTTPSIKEIIQIIESKLGKGDIIVKPKAFIVHGHNETAKLALKNYLQNTLGFDEPTILHEQPNLGRTIIEKFEDYAALSNLVFVLLTPDDIFTKHDAEDDEKRRARQNVIFELGYFLALLGRKTGQTLLLYSGPLDLPSDLSGVIYIDISNGIESAGEYIRREMRNVR